MIHSWVARSFSREEIALLRNAKPQTGERRDAISIPDAKPMEGKTPETTTVVTDENNMTGEDSPDDMKIETNGTLSCEETREVAESDSIDDDSDEAVGKEEAAEQDRDLMDENDDIEEEIIEVQTKKSAKVATMFQKILSLGSQGGQVILKVGADEEGKATPPAPSGPSASQPTLVHNGRMVRFRMLHMNFGYESSHYLLKNL